MRINVNEPKYLMLNCKYIVPKLTYESYLIDVINASSFFKEKCPLVEQYKLVAEQSNGENDVYCSTYQLDFKLLVDEDVMRIRNKKMPDIDYSNMSKGFIISNSKKKVSEVPKNNILKDIFECSYDDIKKGVFKNNTIKSLIKNLKKKKNIFMYYPYEFVGYSVPTANFWASELTGIFKEVLKYRDEQCGNVDTFICIKVNQFFLIFEWSNQQFVFRDKVNDILCTNYRDIKTYSVY